MEFAALALAVLALLIALGARAKASGMTAELEDTRRDSRRRVDELLEHLETELGKTRELVARSAEGGITPRMIRDGQLYTDVTPDEGRELVEKDEVRVLDVRSPGETASGVIPGALLIPIDELERRRAELPSDGKRTLVVCAAGGRSAAACEFLSNEGHGGILNLTGGMGAWSGPVARDQA